MFACLHIPGDRSETTGKLVELAGFFAPSVEVCDPATVIFPVDGLGSLIGSAKDIAAAIAREGERLGIRAHLAIASNPDAALQAARHYSGVTLIAPGQEAAQLGEIPLSQLPMPPEMQDTLSR